jgi:hypothetical protein
MKSENKKSKRVGVIGADGIGKNLILATLLAMERNPGRFFGGMLNHPSLQPDENDLKKGFRLIPLEKQPESPKDYAYLYKDGQKISDMVFRRGGKQTTWCFENQT